MVSAMVSAARVRLGSILVTPGTMPFGPAIHNGMHTSP